jgi:hypothetical protein
MADAGHTSWAPRGRRAGAAPGLSKARRLAVGAGWAAVTGGFVAYLASLDSFKDAYGGVGTGALLLVWTILFSILFRFTPRPRFRKRADAPTPLTAAVRSPAAQSRMLSVMGHRANGLTPRELEMVDWGFAFGVAWAVARRQDPAASEAVVSDRALRAAQGARQDASTAG